MADWSLPLLTSLYVDFMNLLKARDEDSITLGKNTIINPVLGTIKYNRPGNYFEEWNGTAWIPLIISMTSGGLGANTPAGGRAALGLGTMAVQDANNVSITGGTVQNLSSLGVNGAAVVGSLAVNTNATVNGNLQAGALGVSGAAGVAGPFNAYGNAVIGGQLNVGGHAGIAGQLFLGSGGIPVSTPVGLIDATKLAGLVPTANLGNGTPTTQTFLRGDQTWSELNMGAYRNNQAIHVDGIVLTPSTTLYDIPLTGFTNLSKMMWVGASPLEGTNVTRTEMFTGHFWFPNINTLRYEITTFIGGNKIHHISGMVLEVL